MHILLSIAFHPSRRKRPALPSFHSLYFTREYIDNILKYNDIYWISIRHIRLNSIHSRSPAERCDGVSPAASKMFGLLMLFSFALAHLKHDPKLRPAF